MLAFSRGISQVLTKIALSSTTRSTALQRPSFIHASAALRDTNANTAEDAEVDAPEAENQPIDPKLKAKDRTQEIPVEKSIRYLQSDAYKQTYGEKFVWEQYRRNHKGSIPPRKTRKTCIRKGFISTGNPCPICRDEFLVLDHRNIDLLQQFISPHTGEVLSYAKTGLCQKKHLQLMVAVERAWDYGLITFDVPFREYDYGEYYGDTKSGCARS